MKAMYAEAASFVAVEGPSFQVGLHPDQGFYRAPLEQMSGWFNEFLSARSWGLRSRSRSIFVTMFLVISFQRYQMMSHLPSWGMLAQNLRIRRQWRKVPPNLMCLLGPA